MSEHRNRRPSTDAEERKPRSKRRFGSGPHGKKNHRGEDDFRAARRQRRDDQPDDLELDEFADLDDIDEFDDSADDDYSDFDDEGDLNRDYDDGIDWDRD